MRKPFIQFFTAACLFTAIGPAAADPGGNAGVARPAGGNVDNSHLVAPTGNELSTETHPGGNSAATMNEKATGQRSIGTRATSRGTGSVNNYQSDPGLNTHTGSGR